MRMAKCHPDRKHYGHDLCSQCYGKLFYWKHHEKSLAKSKTYRDKNKKLRRVQQRKYLRKDARNLLLINARGRAKRKQIEFSLTKADINIPAVCPLLGIPLKVADWKCNANSPTLDRIDPRKGYTPDNVWVISLKANTMKSNATYNELIKLVKNLKLKIKAVKKKKL